MIGFVLDHSNEIGFICFFLAGFLVVELAKQQRERYERKNKK